jgi:hypothetical protein
VRLRRGASIAALLALAGALTAWRADAAAFAQPAGCRFVLGFARLRELVGPPTVGDCLEDEHHNPENGDGLQRTTGGLLVWRKADNFTAFTDGHRSWVNGPYGLQTRLNTERFAWEAPVVAGVPEPVLGAARRAAAGRLGVPAERVAIVRADPVEWPDAALGCPEPGRAYAQVITPGFRLLARESDRQIEVHADAVGRAVVCV